MSMVTLKDVAERANVSVSLVSKVVNNKMGNSTVSKDKADNILRIAKEMGYVPNLSARSLRLGRADTITVLLPYSKNLEIPVYYDFMIGILEASGKTNYNVSCVFYLQDDSDKNELQCLKNVADSPVAGFIYLPTLRAVVNDEFQDSLRRIINNGIPALSCVVQFNTVNNCFYSVINDSRCGFTAAKHCIDSGYHDIVFINSSAWSRNDGYIKAMMEAGIPTDGLVVSGHESFDREDGYKAFKDIMKGRKKLPEAIIATCDMNAMGIIDAMEEMGISTDEIEIVGFDGLRSLSILHRKYTTVVQPFFDMGYDAVMDMVEHIEHGGMKNKMYEPYIEQRG